MFWKIGAKFYQRTDIKMTLWYVVTFSISVLIISGIMYLRLRHQLIKDVDRFILDETQELTEVLLGTANEAVHFTRFEGESKARRYYPFLFRILNEKGEMFYRSKEFEDTGYVLNNQALINAINGKETREDIYSLGRKRKFRMITSPIFKDGKVSYIIQLGTHLEFVKRSLNNFRENILATLPIILILGSLGGWLLARKSLSPIGYISSKTQTITSKNLSERLTPRGTGDEMDDLIRTINGMIARLEGSFRRMVEFTADASHELKTPICAMRGEAEVLLSKERTAGEYQEGLANFIEQFDHLNQMINDLILLSKSDAAQVELRMTPLRLDLLIKDICHLFQVLTEQKGIALEMEAVQEVTVMGDKIRLQQLFTNLIDNAIKYTSEGSIRVSLKRGEENILVKVQDTGVGIPREEQERIFKRFYRVDKSRSRESGGVGLGLSIAEWVAHAHGGKIEVQSRVGRGSTFAVTLPLLLRK